MGSFVRFSKTQSTEFLVPILPPGNYMAALPLYFAMV